MLSSQAAYLPKPVPEDAFVYWVGMKAEQIKALAIACNQQLKDANTIFTNRNFGITHTTQIDLTGDDGRIVPGTILYNDPQQGPILYCREGKAIRAAIAFTEEGYLPGYRLAMFGLVPGR